MTPTKCELFALQKALRPVVSELIADFQKTGTALTGRKTQPLDRNTLLALRNLQATRHRQLALLVPRARALNIYAQQLKSGHKVSAAKRVLAPLATVLLGLAISNNPDSFDPCSKYNTLSPYHSVWDVPLTGRLVAGFSYEIIGCITEGLDPYASLVRDTFSRVLDDGGLLLHLEGKSLREIRESYLGLINLRLQEEEAVKVSRKQRQEAFEKVRERLRGMLSAEDYRLIREFGHQL